MPENLVFRVDANQQIGQGHLMRCLALAERWADRGGCAAFVVSKETEGLKERLEAVPAEVIFLEAGLDTIEDARQTAQIARQYDAPWIILDGYSFDFAYQQQIKNQALKVAYFDDYGHLERYNADLIINPNLQTDVNLYSKRAPKSKLLLGPRYQVLRRQFLNFSLGRRRYVKKNLRILVTFGGSDPYNLTLKTAAALSSWIKDSPEQVQLVVGSYYAHYGELQAFCRQNRESFSLMQYPENLPDLMSNADLAISAAGITCFELAWMNTPTLIYISSENQFGNAQALDRCGAMVNLGWASEFDQAAFLKAFTALAENPALRQVQMRCCRRLLDGQGADRIVATLQDSPIRLRRVAEKDARLLWRWANDPLVRAASFQEGLISWETHLQWLSGKLHDPQCCHYIGLDAQDEEIGQIRFDVYGNEAEIHVSISPDKRGLGLGSKLIKAAASELFRTTSVQTIHAYVKATNEASRRTFLKAGFSHIATCTGKDEPAVHFIKKCSNLPKDYLENNATSVKPLSLSEQTREVSYD
ncbi:MAG: UDP-2,4-diacetamido-2,4,6-trideoxy-beta-L-altropyranose hydrolase [bacterium]